MTINQIECFVEAARCLNFTKAADNLYMSQQTMSRQIRALEQELGILVFRRKNVGVELTEAGQLLFHSWEPMIESYYSSIDKAKDLYFGADTQLRVGVSDLGDYVSDVMQALLRYNEEYPELEIESEMEPFPAMLDRLENNKLHLIVTYRAETTRIPELNYVSVPNTHYEVGIIMSRNHPLAQKEQVGIEDIQNEVIAVLGPEISNDHADRIVNWFRKHDLARPPRLKSYNSFRNLQIALSAGKCVAVMFRRVMDGMEGHLKFYPVDDPDARVNTDIVIVWKKKKYEAKAKRIAQLLDHLARGL